MPYNVPVAFLATESTQEVIVVQSGQYMCSYKWLYTRTVIHLIVIDHNVYFSPVQLSILGVFGYIVDKSVYVDFLNGKI